MMALVEHYLAVRRASGFKMDSTARRLRRFADFAAARGDAHVRAETSIVWAGRAATPHARAIRLRDLGLLASFLRAEDPGHEIPPADVYTFRWQKRPPHLYTVEEIRAVLEAAGRRGPRGSSVADTYQTLIGLLATTGLRVGEALRLQLGDWTTEGLVIRETKFRKSRLVPLHPTAHAALRAYCTRWRAQADPTEPLIVSIHGTALHYGSVFKMFRKLLRSVGLRTSAGPLDARTMGYRIHDLRHTYAVRALETCPDGRDAIRRHMLALTTALGHVSVSDTYWYLHVSPQLMTDIADACEALDIGGTP